MLLTTIHQSIVKLQVYLWVSSTSTVVQRLEMFWHLIMLLKESHLNMVLLHEEKSLIQEGAEGTN